MKRFPTVESVKTHLRFSQWKVEKYFNDSSLNDQELLDKFSNNFETIACRSVHIAVKGHVQVVFARSWRRASKSVDIPTSAHFLVTGIRKYKRPYSVAFVVSLS